MTPSPRIAPATALRQGVDPDGFAVGWTLQHDLDTDCWTVTYQGRLIARAPLARLAAAVVDHTPEPPDAPTVRSVLDWITVWATPPRPAADRPRVAICSPFRARPGESLAQHRLWAQCLCRLAYEEGCWPIAPHLDMPQWLDDDTPAERADALAVSTAAMAHVAGVYAFTPTVPSPGMIAELAAARRHGRPVRRVTYAELAAVLPRLPGWRTLADPSDLTKE